MPKSLKESIMINWDFERSGGPNQKTFHACTAYIFFSFLGDSLHISPLERSYKAKVLMHFPSNVEWNPFDEDAVRMVSPLIELVKCRFY